MPPLSPVADTNPTSTPEGTESKPNGSGQSATPLVLTTAIFCLFLSGLAGLLYQVVWTRYLALITGHTSYAIIAVLVVFMGGLAWGNYELGKRADKLRRPLEFYGWLEIVIAAYAFAFPFIFEWSQSAFRTVANSEMSGHLLLSLKFLFAMVNVLLPAFLMGGTLPVLTRGATRALSQIRRNVSHLYFINSAGAAIGVGISEFWLIPGYGLHQTVAVGGFINLLVGAVALVVGRGLPDIESAPEASKNEDKDSSLEQYSPAELKLAMATIGLSGFVAMLYEIAWTRMLALSLGTTSHAFATMLMTFISGIAIGAWLVGRLKLKTGLLNLFAWLEIGIGVSIGLMMMLYHKVPEWSAWALLSLSHQAEFYSLLLVVQTLLCVSVMLIPTVLLGMTLPLVSQIATVSVAVTGRSVGSVFSINTVGNVLGSLATGLLLMPTLGLARTFAFGVGLNLAIGWLILNRHRAEQLGPKFNGVAAALVLVPVLLAGLLDKRWQFATSAGFWRTETPKDLRARIKTSEDVKILYHRDGSGSTITVKDHGDSITLSVNGKVDASSAFDLSTQILLGQIPMMMHPDPKQALVVGLGSGMSAGSMTTHPALQHLDVVEISPEVADTVHYFAEFNRDLGNHPKCQIHVEDAKSFLTLTRKKYDVIASEPSNIWMTGVAGVFTKEYYQILKSRLAEGGLVSQWFHDYNTTDKAVEIIIATFTSEFPYASMWSTLGGDLLLVGSTQPMTSADQNILNALKYPSIQSELSRIGLQDSMNFLALQILSEEYTRFIPPPDTPFHSDYFPILETLAQTGHFTQKQSTLWQKVDQRGDPQADLFFRKHHPAVDLTGANIISLGANVGQKFILQNEHTISLIEALKAKSPTDPTSLVLETQIEDRNKAELAARSILSNTNALRIAVERSPTIAAELVMHVMQDFRTRKSIFHTPDTGPVTQVVEMLLPYADVAPLAHIYLAELAWYRGELEEFSNQMGAALSDPGTGAAPDFSIDLEASERNLALLLRYLMRAGNNQGAINAIKRASYVGLVSDSEPVKDPWLNLMLRKLEHEQREASLQR